MKLEVTYAGRWYFGLTALLAGVCAISSNNVIYLIESVLLASLLVSVAGAYHALREVTIEWRRLPAISGSPCVDQIRVFNRAASASFCVEVGEWRAGRFSPLAFFARVPAGGSVVGSVRQTFARRGRHEWDGIAVASSYPLGLFRLIRVKHVKGARVVWPARALSGSAGGEDAGRVSVVRAGTAVVEGEIRPMSPDDDWRSVVWTLSARGGEPVVRARGTEREDPAVVLDLRGLGPGEELERRISQAAASFYGNRSGQSPEPSAGGTLVLIDERGKARFNGVGPSLDQLALVDRTAAKDAA